MTAMILRCNWRFPFNFKNTRAMNTAKLFASSRPCASTCFRGCSARTFASSTKDQSDPEEPVKFTNSKAFKVDPVLMRSEPDSKNDDKQWFQFPIISISVISLLVYFCILREENDIDELIANESTLSSVFREQQKRYLRTTIERLQKEGADTSEHRLRLDALEHEETAKPSDLSPIKHT